jgi:hypothetical protein
MRPVPRTADGWAEEIAAAYEDAREALPFTPLVGVVAGARELFHLAPHVAMKFRGLPESRRQAAVEAALSTYVASEGSAPLDDPRLAFALCYLASHFGLDLVSQDRVDEVMDHLASRVNAAQSRKRMPNNALQRTAPGKSKRRR